MDVQLPTHLYKYAPLAVLHTGPDGEQISGFDAIEDILTRNRIYYSDPRNFNDPFEFDRVIERLANAHRVEIARRVEEKVMPDGTSKASLAECRPSHLTAKILSEMDQIEVSQHYSRTDTIIHRCGYISLCDSNDNVLMWSHYADFHRGLCLRFVCRQDPFYEEKGSGRIGTIAYGDTIDAIELGQDSPTEAALHRIFRKAACWQYENEYRAYRLPSSDKADDAHGNAPFNSELVDEVYLGLKTPPADIKRVLAIVARAKHDIKVYLAQKDQVSLRLTFRPIVE